MRTLDPIERKKLWAQMDGAALKLGVPSLPKLHIGMLVEKDGVILTNQREEGHSWLRTAWVLFYSLMSQCTAGGVNNYGSGYMSFKRITGTVYYSAGSNPASSCGDMAILVGTGDTAFDIDQYNLAAVIGNGTGAGQLSHTSTSNDGVSYDTGVWTATHSRKFNNNSGDTITVKETGLQYSCNIFWSGGITALLARDVLGSPVAVANGAQLTVTYEISMDFSSIDT